MRRGRALAPIIAVALAIGVWLDTNSAAAASTLGPGQWLYPGQYIQAPDATQQLRLWMQTDGNLVLYSGSRAIWASNTCCQTVQGAVMQTDGNLVIRKPNWTPIWASNTSGNANAYLDLQDDCNAVIYRPVRTPIWATNTFDCTYAVTGTPFGGWWDRFAFSHPSNHHLVECEPGFGTHQTKPACNYSFGPGGLVY